MYSSRTIVVSHVRLAASRFSGQISFSWDVIPRRAGERSLAKRARCTFGTVNETAQPRDRGGCCTNKSVGYRNAPVADLAPQGPRTRLQRAGFLRTLVQGRGCGRPACLGRVRTCTHECGTDDTGASVGLPRCVSAIRRCGAWQRTMTGARAGLPRGCVAKRSGRAEGTTRTVIRRADRGRRWGWRRGTDRGTTRR